MTKLKKRTVQIDRPDDNEAAGDLVTNLMSREEFIGVTIRHKGPVMLEVADGPEALIDMKREDNLLGTVAHCTIQETVAEGWSGPEIWVSALSYLQSLNHRCLGFICGDIERVLHLMGNKSLNAHNCESSLVDGQYHLFGMEGYQDPELPGDRLIFIGAPVASAHLAFADLALIYHL